MSTLTAGAKTIPIKYHRQEGFGIMGGVRGDDDRLPRGMAFARAARRSCLPGGGGVRDPTRTGHSRQTTQTTRAPSESIENPILGTENA